MIFVLYTKDFKFKSPCLHADTRITHTHTHTHTEFAIAIVTMEYLVYFAQTKMHDNPHIYMVAYTFIILHI